MSDFLYYWTAENARFTRTAYNGKIKHAASNQFKRVAVKDRLWILSCEDKDFFLLGPLIIKTIVDADTARRKLRQDDLYPATYHAFPRLWGAKKMKWIPLTEKQLMDLRFAKTKNDRLPPDYTAENLQTMRLLTHSSADMLGAIYRKGKA